MTRLRFGKLVQAAVLMGGLALAGPALAEDPAPADTPDQGAAAAAPADASGGMTEEEKQHALAKASQNPVANMISVPFENNFFFGAGPEEKHVNVLNIKPVIPVGVTAEWNLINRFILPVIWAQDQDLLAATRGRGSIDFGGSEVFPALGGSNWGLGNLTYQGFISPAKPGKFIWGVGPALQLPTNTDTYGADAWSGGITAVVLTMPGHWVLGGVVQQIWSFAKAGGQDDISSFLLQPFINYNLPKGWYLSTAPVVTANWEADSGNTWTLPLGGGIGKIVKIGKQPINFKVAGYYNALRPEFGPKWNLQFTMTFLFPKK